MKTIIQIVLWLGIILFGYLIYDSVKTPIKFKEEKDKRYQPVVKRLIKIQKSEKAFGKVNDSFSSDFDNLIRFVDTADFAIVERRDTSFLDEEFKKNFGVDKYIDKVIEDTIGHTPVKDSLFGDSKEYQEMKYVPGTDKEKEFELDAGTITSSGKDHPVFRARVDKAIVLDGLNENLIVRDKKKKSVEDITGPYIQVGSMEKMNTEGNWPKSYVK